MKNLFSLLIVFLCSISFAQETIDTLIVQNNGTVMIEMDPEINRYITSIEKTSCPVASTRPAPTTNTSRPKPNTSDPCAGKTQMLGYKIQVYYSKDRAQANKVKEEFSRSFPSFSAETAYMAPDYRVLVGDYFTRSSANADIRKIKGKYNSAFPIQYRILCRRAK
ncbi:SPOR domain-containing protein [Vaginella massiliensis]|uniref:SPOR domain-containing protein n=1 Tax=Vaginella massiliensis TaxID=1816680 RepID=UPI003750910A